MELRLTSFGMMVIMFKIYEITFDKGAMGICPVPGRFSPYIKDLELILAWKPDIVITLTEWLELQKVKGTKFSSDLKKENIQWLHFPISDFGIPDASDDDWDKISKQIHACLAFDGRILCHCFGGCGRSGMIVMRIMCELGESGDRALIRLRKIRECAVETAAQKQWAEAARINKL